MMKLLDYYYLVLLRHYDNWYKKDRLSYSVPGVMMFPFMANILSFAILLIPNIVDQIAFWVTWIIIGILMNIVIDLFYNKKRSEMYNRANERCDFEK